MRTLAVVFGIAALAFSIIQTTNRAQARPAQFPSGPIPCWVQSFDAIDPTGPDNYFWEAVTTCDQPVEIITVMSFLYEYDWNQANWYPLGYLDADIRTFADWVAKSGTKYVAPTGYHCVETASQHLIVQAGYIPPIALLPSLSPSQCY